MSLARCWSRATKPGHGLAGDQARPLVPVRAVTCRRAPRRRAPRQNASAFSTWRVRRGCRAVPPSCHVHSSCHVPCIHVSPVMSRPLRRVSSVMSRPLRHVLRAVRHVTCDSDQRAAPIKERLGSKGRRLGAFWSDSESPRQGATASTRTWDSDWRSEPAGRRGEAGAGAGCAAPWTARRAAAGRLGNPAPCPAASGVSPALFAPGRPSSLI